MRPLVAVVALVAATAGMAARTFVRLRRPPANDPATVLARGGPVRPAVVCAGASTVHGNVSFNYVDELARRLPDREWVNAGINGENSAQLLDRLAGVVACRPTHVVLHVGANDLRSGEDPALESYGANLATAVERLRDAGARVAVMSVQLVAGRPDSADNRDVARLNEVARRVTTEARVAYLPLAERLAELLARRPGRPIADSPWPKWRGWVLRLGLGVGLDRIRRLGGYAIHTDGLHLADEAGLIAADLIEEFVLARPAAGAPT